MTLEKMTGGEMSSVTMICHKCGASIAEVDTFCTKCGTQRNSAPIEAAKMQRFCLKCGSPLFAETKFCGKCGTLLSGPATSVVSSSSAAAAPTLEVARPQVTPSTASVGGGKGLKFLMAGVALAMLILILVMGSCAYIAHRAKQKAHAIEEAFKRNGTNAVAHELGIKVPADNPVASGSNQPTSEATATAPSVPATAPVATPIAPVAASGDQPKDWALKYERTENGPEADLVVRTGDINNLGFGWPQGFDPFSGNSTPSHGFPWNPRADEPDGTDRIMLGSAVDPTEALRDMRHYNSYGSDGYSHILSDCEMLLPNQTCKERQDSWPQPVILPVGKLPSKISAILVQLFVDDFQAAVFHSHFQVSLNGTRIPSFEYSINSLNQTGPIGKLVSLKLLPEYWPLLESGEVKLLIDDPTTKMRDGYAIDFVRILVNPHKFKYEVSLAASVIDADKHTPIPGASVTAGLQSASTDTRGKCQLIGLPAGLVTATGAAPGYDENSVPVDLISGQTGTVEIPLHRHEEGAAALERSIEQTGSATIYGIHFDTDSAKLRADSMPALNAVLGLINNHPGSQWVIAGHTDNQGNEEHNQPLSQKRAASVIAWLKAHGVEQLRLTPQGFGATRPVADNATASGRALNRRVEISVAK